MTQHLITTVLSKQQCTNAEAAQLSALAKQFPYCSPLQVLDIAATGKARTTAQERLASLHKGNVFLFSSTIASFNKQAKSVTGTVPADDAMIAEPYAAQDYFGAQHISESDTAVAAFVEAQIEKNAAKEVEPVDDDAQLLVTRTFTEWLAYFRKKKEMEEKEHQDKEKVRGMWQRAKLAAAAEAEEDDDALPEEVFDQAMNSINLSSDTISEGLAKVLEIQRKYDKSIEMYRKLSLLYPEKSAYFASQIQRISNL
jgi:hypothetical protein